MTDKPTADESKMTEKEANALLAEHYGTGVLSLDGETKGKLLAVIKAGKVGERLVKAAPASKLTGADLFKALKASGTGEDKLAILRVPIDGLPAIEPTADDPGRTAVPPNPNATAEDCIQALWRVNDGRYDGTMRKACDLAGVRIVAPDPHRPVLAPKQIQGPVQHPAMNEPASPASAEEATSVTAKTAPKNTDA